MVPVDPLFFFSYQGFNFASSQVGREGEGGGGGGELVYK